MKTFRRQPITFTVVGGLAFPLDMLRYDSCWPDANEDVQAMHDSLDHSEAKPYRVKLRSHYEPTPSRWQSFGWRVQ